MASSPAWATAKEDLVVLCAKMAGRQMAPDDIVYKVMKWPQGYQATVTLECLDAAEYAGDLCNNEQDAEKAAARQALLAYPNEVEQLRHMSELGASRGAAASSGSGAGLPGGGGGGGCGGLGGSCGGHGGCGGHMPGGGGCGGMGGGGGCGMLGGCGGMGGCGGLPPPPPAPPDKPDPKADLEMLCAQRKGTVLGPQDIIYEVTKWPQGFQATVTIGMNGARYAGDLCNNAEDAERAAANQAVIAIAEENKQESMMLMQQQRHMLGQSLTNGVDETPKFDLATLCVKVAGRRMVKDDIVYKAVKWDQGYQATVSLNCLTGASYAGELCSSIEESEVAAAKQAIIALGSDPEAVAAKVAANAAGLSEMAMLGGGMAASMMDKAEAAIAAENLYAEMLAKGMSWQEIAAQAAGLPPGVTTPQTDAAAAILAAAATGNATGLVNGAGGVDINAFLASQGVTDISAYVAALTGLDPTAAAGMAMAAMNNSMEPAPPASKMMPDFSRSVASSRSGGPKDGERPPKKPKNEMPCRFYMKGFQPGFTPGPQHCRNGDQCAFSHDPELIKKALEEGPMEPLQKNSHIACKFHMAGPGRCYRGDDCNFSHDPEVIANAIATGDVVPYIPRDRMGVPPRHMLKAEVCRYLINGICRSGQECPYAHGIEDFRGDLNPENYQLLVSLRQSSPPPERDRDKAKAADPKAKSKSAIPAAFKTQAFRMNTALQLGEVEAPQESSGFQRFDSFEPRRAQRGQGGGAS